jgi:hypothetical protein
MTNRSLYAGTILLVTPNPAEPTPSGQNGTGRTRDGTPAAPDRPGDCWGPSASEGPQKHDLTMFLEYNT